MDRLTAQDRMLVGRGERVDGLVLRAAVPVSLHQEQPGQAQGNRDGMMVVPLPIGEPDNVRRLRLITAETSRRKRKYRPQGGTLFRSVVVQRAFLRLAPHQRLTNTYAANVPEGPVPLYFAGARLLEVFSVVPIVGNVSLGWGRCRTRGSSTSPRWRTGRPARTSRSSPRASAGPWTRSRPRCWCAPSLEADSTMDRPRGEGDGQ